MWTTRTVLILSLCFLEDLLFGGTIYGWPSLAYIYRDLGVFACAHNQTGELENSTAGCPDQDMFLPLALTVGLVGRGLGALVIGWMFDRYGLRITRTVTINIGVAGSLCLAFANRNHAYLIFPGTILTGIACSSVILTNHHVALLAGKRAPVFNILYSGADNSAGIVYFFIKLAYGYGFSQKWSLIILSALWILVALTTFLLLPRFKIQPFEEANETKILGENVRNVQLEGILSQKASQGNKNGLSLGNGLGKENFKASWTMDDYAASNYEIVKESTKNCMTREDLENAHLTNESFNGITKPKLNDDRKNQNAVIKKTMVENNSKHGIYDEQSLPVKSVWYYMFSFRFISHVVYLCLVHFWMGLVIGIMNTWLTSIYKGDITQVSHFTNIYAYIMFACGFLLSPFAGGLTDAVRRLLEGRSDGALTITTRAMVAVPGMIISSVAAILVAVFMLLEESWSVYLVFTFMEVTRGFVYGNVAAYIILVFPLEHFGVLHGVIFAVTAGTLALQYGSMRWVEATGYTPMVSFQLAMVMLSLLHPGIIIVQYLRERRPNIVYITRL